MVRHGGDHLIVLLDFNTQGVDGCCQFFKPGVHISPQFLIVSPGFGSRFLDFSPYLLDVMLKFSPQFLLVLSGFDSRFSDFSPQLLKILREFIPQSLDFLMNFGPQLPNVFPGFGSCLSDFGPYFFGVSPKLLNRIIQTFDLGGVSAQLVTASDQQHDDCYSDTNGGNPGRNYGDDNGTFHVRLLARTAEPLTVTWYQPWPSDTMSLNVTRSMGASVSFFHW